MRVHAPASPEKEESELQKVSVESLESQVGYLRSDCAPVMQMAFWEMRGPVYYHEHGRE